MVMAKNSVDFESVLSVIDKAITPTYLNPTQEIVLREVWNGKTYNKMAYDYNYDPEYIKTVGCSLWQTLSRAFDEQINKSNFVPFMRRRLESLLDETTTQRLSHAQSDRHLAEVRQLNKPQLCNWTTAPKIRHFLGREAEIDRLYSWSQDSDCRLVVVSGMTGCGKTTLVTEFANTVKQEFDCVIWFSLSQLPSLSRLLSKYLATISGDADPIDSEPPELSFLLSEFIECLRKQKILLILDGLQHILEVERSRTSYKENYEGYGQFLRSIISTNHQSLLLVTSRIKPKLLEYYASDRVKFLDLQGFKAQATQKFIGLGCQNISPEDRKLLQLSKSLQNNPQLLKIATSYPDIFMEEDVEQIVYDLSQLEIVGELLEQELGYLSCLEKEIIYWLAIACSPLSLKELAKSIEHPQPKLKFINSVKSLVVRSLAIEQNNAYLLMPVMRAYLRRKLVKQAL